MPFDVDLAELEARPDSEWERLELPETHFEWTVDQADEGDPRARVEAVVDELWSIAVAWSRESGKWCDFQLVAFDPDGDVLFEDGCRCWLDPPPRRSRGPTPDGPNREPVPGHGPVTVAVDYEAINDLEGRKDRFLDRLAQDRNWSFATAQEAMSAAQQAMSAAPTVLEQVGDILQRTVSYQHDVVSQLRDQSTGQAEARKHAVTETEITRRRRIRADLTKHLIDNTLSTVVPLASSIASYVMNRRVEVCPQFRRAQDAMLYLLYSLSPTRLCRICDGSKQAAGAFLALLEDGAKFQSERDALFHITDLIMLLRAEVFEQAATSEEHLAARYLIGRFALFKADECSESDYSPT